MDAGERFTRHRPPALRPRGLVLRPAELAAIRRQLRLVVGLVDVRERHRLAAVPLADPLIVRQVDADGGHRSGIAGLDDDVDGARGDADDIRPPPFRIPRHADLEPRRGFREPPQSVRLLVVHVEDQRFPRALHAARVEIVLDEAVDRVDRTVLVLDPRDVVRHAVRVVAGLVEANQRFERPAHRRRRVRAPPPGGAGRHARGCRRSGRQSGRPLRRGCRSTAPAVSSVRTAPRTTPGRPSSRRRRGCSRSRPGCRGRRPASSA